MYILLLWYPEVVLCVDCYFGICKVVLCADCFSGICEVVLCVDCDSGIHKVVLCMDCCCGICEVVLYAEETSVACVHTFLKAGILSPIFKY